MLRTVKWTSNVYLPCICCDGAEVVLCVDPEKVAPKLCPGTDPYDPYQPFEYSTIDAVLTCWCKSCKDPELWTYTFSYDDDQLIEDAVISSGDITGAFCRGCLTEWIEEIVGNEPYLDDDGEGLFTFVSNHGCEYQFNCSNFVGGCNYPRDFIFGDGSDGDLTVLNGENLELPSNRNFYFNNLTIEEGGSLANLGHYYLSISYPDTVSPFQIYVSGTLTINGTLHYNGRDGTDAVGSVAGKEGYADTPEDYPGDSCGGGNDWGGNGGRGTSGAGFAQNGEAAAGQRDGGSVVLGISGIGYMGGGYGGSAGAGGNGGTAGSDPDPFWGFPFKIRSFKFDLTTFSSEGSLLRAAIGGGSGAPGGGGGERTGTAIGGGGGGGGAGGGSIWCAARNIVIGSTGKITANGGDGGDGADGTPGGGGDNAGGGGAGGGGGGGLIYLIFEHLTNDGSIEVNPGSGGNGGAGVGAFVAGGDGTDGDPGNIYLLNMRTGLFE